MARLTNKQKDIKLSQGRNLYIKGFSLQTISEIIEISVDSLKKWRDENDWEEAKELSNISPSEIKGLILETVKDIKEGKKPKYKADDISKLVAAFDKITDKRKQAIYTMESFNDFSNWILGKAAKSKGKKRQELIDLTQTIRTQQDEYVSHLLQDE